MNSQPQKGGGLNPTQEPFSLFASTQVDAFLWLRIHSPKTANQKSA